jgi:hypothetical protein
MTLPPEQIGDKGQRFVVEIKDYPNEGWQVCAYSDTYEGAKHFGETLVKAPTATDHRIIDRESTDE